MLCACVSAFSTAKSTKLSYVRMGFLQYIDSICAGHNYLGSVRDVSRSSCFLTTKKFLDYCTVFWGQSLAASCSFSRFRFSILISFSIRFRSFSTWELSFTLLCDFFRQSRGLREILLELPPLLSFLQYTLTGTLLRDSCSSSLAHPPSCCITTGLRSFVSGLTVIP